MSAGRYAVAALCLALVAWLLANIWGDRVRGCDVVEGGSKLILNRSGFDTVRARFCYAQDCELIANQMNKAEHDRWRCL